ncbi:MAG TPA: YhfC family intramembrane metalloprotease [Candidatus Deferrimicrobium sp.]|nr:YhfC family intramembrane metalloprotease [Candidatus Deferrimicrobium sp.]
MISNVSIIGMVFSLLVSVGFPIVLLVYSRKKFKISFKAVGVGIITWIVFSQILEKIFHVTVLKVTPIMTYPLIFAIYAALAAGVFEEVGRYISYKLFLKGKTEWKDGLAFGIGHGGIEALLIGLSLGIQNILFSTMINSGTFEQLTGKLPAETIDQITKALFQMTPLTATLSGFERVFAVISHIFFSLLVLYGIKINKKVYLLLAILAHALMDFFAALYQVRVITNILTVEALLLVFTIVACFSVNKFKSLF